MRRSEATSSVSFRTQDGRSLVLQGVQRPGHHAPCRAIGADQRLDVSARSQAGERDQREPAVGVNSAPACIPALDPRER